MTDRLTEIKLRWPRPAGLDDTTSWANSDIEWLIAEVDRLREVALQLTATLRKSGADFTTMAAYGDDVLKREAL